MTTTGQSCSLNNNDTDYCKTEKKSWSETIGHVRMCVCMCLKCTVRAFYNKQPHKLCILKWKWSCNGYNRPNMKLRLKDEPVLQLHREKENKERAKDPQSALVGWRRWTIANFLYEYPVRIALKPVIWIISAPCCWRRRHQHRPIIQSVVTRLASKYPTELTHALSQTKTARTYDQHIANYISNAFPLCFI